jgi:ADP-ribose pyrophosphatase YjhB (NUDIX family)
MEISEGDVMAGVHCSAVVHWEGGVVLVREGPKAKWRLPDRTLQGDEGPILCVRRCVLQETGYRAQVLRLFKVVTKGDFPKQSVRFVFGCQIEPVLLQDSKLQLGTFSPDEVLQLAQKDEFDDQLLIKLIYDFKNHTPAPAGTAEAMLF